MKTANPNPRAALAVLLLAVFAGCGSNPQAPDLKRLYGSSSGAVEQPPVILVPGIMGSRLEHPDAHRETWPGSLRKLLFNDYADLAFEIDAETLEPKPSAYKVAGLTDRIAGRDFYGAILRTLEEAGGYRAAVPGEPAAATDRRYYILPYDWREDHVATVRVLDELIEQI